MVDGSVRETLQQEAEGDDGQAGKAGGPVLEGTSVLDVASFLAQAFVEQLGLSSCVLYLYNRERTHLLRLAGSGIVPTSHWPDTVSVDHGSPLGEFEMVPGQPGAALTIPLWDGKALLGVAYGRLPADRVFDDGLLSLSRAVACAGSSAVAVALATASSRKDAAAGRNEAARMLRAPATPNPYLRRHLAAVLRAASPHRPVAAALLRLAGPHSRGWLPIRGTPIPPPPGAAAKSTGRGYGFGASSNTIALVWTGVTREQMRASLRGAATGRLPLSTLVGSACAPEEVPPVVAGSMCLYPEDSPDADAMLGGVSDLLDLETYLMSSGTQFEERIGPSSGIGGRMARVMDSHFLAAEIDLQREALNKAIDGGGNFQDPEVREISERLDRLIVVMQRFMGHRGSTP